MPYPHECVYIAPKLARSLAHNTHLRKVKLTNSNLQGGSVLLEVEGELPLLAWDCIWTCLICRFGIQRWLIIRDRESSITQTIEMGDPRPSRWASSHCITQTIEMGASLQENSSVVHLNVESNPLSADALTAIAHCLKMNKSICSFFSGILVALVSHTKAQFTTL